MPSMTKDLPDSKKTSAEFKVRHCKARGVVALSLSEKRAKDISCERNK